MAKFWRNIRNIIHNVPIPGVGITINQAKEVAGTIKDNPGSVIVVETPPPGAPPPPEDVLIAGVTFRQAVNKYMLYIVIAAALFLFYMTFIRGKDKPIEYMSLENSTGGNPCK